ncbi:proteasome component PRE6 [Verticillium dahliae VdLs.17]|uniref:Proteasome component PRE6 n=1 Tax=Verticillium dahliae (strain VdLs.17 / ATCC MYA-4575 / FGSC 10137) TaxID=498257 RepID=G2X0G9_VERDV|nr:proteasome component PRE6 [Verticillium dahliae VdLs.17]EGY22310.1 proteasome component PRE6 [Verticillium dahliae VdLs.17]
MASGYDRALSGRICRRGREARCDRPPSRCLLSSSSIPIGTCAVGVKGQDVVVLGCEKRSAMKLQDTRITPSKLQLLDTHVCLAFAGLNADARILVDKARLEAQSHKLTVEDPASIEYMTKYVAGVQQRYTQSGGVRPFGISTLIVGFDNGSKVPRLYQTEPSGIYSACYVKNIEEEKQEEAAKKKTGRTPGQGTAAILTRPAEGSDE